ncbi:MAG TPA: response regulator transcription factor [Burkholderiaceae bacterium]|nr:response regulator transcription factor [Burkholderiaceae bacterium]
MRVLLVDDHPLILAALQTVVNGLGDDLEVLAVDSEAAAREALGGAAAFDLMLLDLELGASDGFEVLAEFRRLHPACPIVVLSTSERASDVIRAIDAGAMGFVPKRARTDTLFEALRLVMSGGIYVPPLTLDLAGAPAPAAVEGDTVPDVMRPHPLDTGDEASSVGRPSAAVTPTFESLGLSRRQADVLAYLLKGLPNKLIAREMNLSIETVKDHVAAVLRALKVSSRTQAVLAVSQMTRQARSGDVGQAQGWRPSGH